MLFTLQKTAHDAWTATLTHNHFFSFIYNHACRACEIGRFTRQLPRGGNKTELKQFVLDSPILNYWDKERLIEEFNLNPVMS